MTEHEQPEQTTERTPAEESPNPERPDPPGNPAEHTSPRSNPDPDPDRLEIATEDQERTIGT
jgi:hypothetical protein